MPDSGRTRSIFAPPDAAAAPGAALRDRGAGERRQAALAEIGREGSGAAADETSFLDAARTAARALELGFAGAVRSPSEGHSLTLLWSPASDRAALAGEKTLSAEAASSAWAYALAERKLVAIEDLARETRFDGADLRAAGIASGAICPLGYGRRVLGAIGVFDAQPRRFAADELAFLDSVAVLVASASVRRETERALNCQSQFLSNALDGLEGLAVLLSPAGVVEKMNAACHTITGLEEEAIGGKLFWETIVPGTYGRAVQEAIDRLRQGEAVARLETPLCSGGGGDRRAMWTFTILQRADGRLQAIVGSAVETTPRFLAVDRGEHDNPEAQNRTVIAALEQSLREGRMPPRAVIDDFFELQAEPESAPRVENEKRAKARREFPFLQSLVPWNGGRLPSLQAFMEVRCRDLSPWGVSFYQPRRPAFERFVMALGTDENKVHVIGQISHITPTESHGAAAFLIGSQFLARVYY